MESQNGRLLPTVQEHETNRVLTWQVELPRTDRLELSLDGRLLTVRVLHSGSKHPEFRIHPEATGV
jgi:hypothetical protein